MKPDEIHNNYGYGSEHDDAHIYYQAWLQKRQDEETDDEAIFSTPELGI